MREWSLRVGDPLSLTLAADMRFGPPDYLNDHIWELSLSSGEPPSLSIQTTYGLRARNMRFFYRFLEAGKSVITPASFHEAPRVLHFYPDFLVLRFVPIEGLEVTAEYWVPESHVIAGRLTFANRTTFPRHLDFELCGLLSPLGGKAFGPAQQHQMVRILTGSTGGLEPVVFMSGGPRRGIGPHPALTVGLDFEAGVSRSLTWACAAEASLVESFDLARRVAGRNWDAARARLELLNARHVVDIFTGDPDWDAALALSQKAAFSVLFPGGDHLPNSSFVRTRTPDNGHSRKGDGSDHASSWNGQSPFDAYYLSSLLPGAPELRLGLLRNFLSVQAEDGTIDAKPGLAGQRARFLAAPLLASMAWDLYQETHDDQFLADAFPRLHAFFNSWFAADRDQDADGIPEWEHLLQTGFDENPLFDVWYPWSQSLNIQTLLNPELESLLFREAASLIGMAERLGRESELADLRQRAPRLTASIAAAWNGRMARYAYRDRRTGASWTDRLIGSRKGPGELVPRRPECEQPVRLVIQVHTKAAAATRPTVEIFGRSNPPARIGARKKARNGESQTADDRPQSERIAAQQFQWRSGGLVAISELVYGKVERVVVEGLDEKDRVVVRTVNTAGEDITLFTPIWARVPHPDHVHSMVARLLRDEEGFDRPFGIPALPASPSSARAGTREQIEAEAMAMSVHLPWNNLIGEGLLAYGFRDEAARLITRLMSAVVTCLKHTNVFYERYHALTGAGMGERGSLAGFAPVGLFLKTLGVQILSPTSVRLEGRNPFPWPVTIVYRGMRLVRGLEGTEITFPNAAPITVTDPEPCIVNA
jgi:hypothetical protein